MILFISLAATPILIYFHQNWTIALANNERLSTLQQLIYELIPEVLGTLIIVGISYFLLRLLLTARAELEILQISKIISEELAEKMPEIDGPSKFAIGRESLSKLTPMGELFRRSQNDISLLATQHGYVVKQHLKLLGEMAGLGRKIRILMMSPFDKRGDINPLVQLYEARYINYSGTQSELETNKQRLQQWYAALPPVARENVELRVHFDLPVGNFTIIDHNLNSGVVQVEPYIFADFEVGELVVYVAHRKTSKQFFDLHVRTFNWLWQRGFNIVSSSDENQTNE
jgi:hypothetical protein